MFAEACSIETQVSEQLKMSNFARTREMVIEHIEVVGSRSFPEMNADDLFGRQWLLLHSMVFSASRNTITFNPGLSKWAQPSPICIPMASSGAMRRYNSRNGYCFPHADVRPDSDYNLSDIRTSDGVAGECNGCA
jgi:hypothetical protein